MNNFVKLVFLFTATNPSCEPFEKQFPRLCCWIELRFCLSNTSLLTLMLRLVWKRNRDECDVAQFMLDPENKEAQAKCKAFVSLAEKRHTSLKHLDSSDFAEKAAKSMEEIRTALAKTQAWKILKEDQQNSLWSRVQSNVLNEAWEQWRSPELRDKDMAFTAKGESVFPTISPKDFSVSSLVPMNPHFSSAVRELEKLNQFQTPADIIQILSNCKDTVDSLPSSPMTIHGLCFHCYVSAL